ncbi:sensor histidine kinase [Allohahella marinimesophila]|uniref:histidine kinase n=1 Tax=Allohahella marinimesophila TaxID=1054972 RepID=A0ABP7PFA2_9GAMM
MPEQAIAPGDESTLPAGEQKSLDTGRPDVKPINWQAIIAIVIAALLINSAVAFEAIRSYGEVAQNRTVSQETDTAVLSLLAAVQNAESGRRGFLLTLDEAYLEPYQSSTSLQDRALGVLDELIPVGNERREHLDRLHELVLAKRIEIDQTISLARSGQMSEALVLVRAGNGDQLMNDIREQIRAIEERGLQTLSRLNEELGKTNAKALLTLALSLLFSLVLVLAFAWLLRRFHTESREHALRLEAANDELEDKVAARTAELNSFSKELERSNRELQDFAYVASHDLQEPLRKIRAFGDRLAVKYGDALAGTGSDYIRRMQAAAERMAALIDALLTYSRVSTTIQEFEPVELETVVSDVLEDLEVRINDRNAQIDYKYLPPVYGVPVQLRQLMQNLIGNALKFVDTDVRPHVSISATTTYLEDGETPAVELRVKDNGIGIDEVFIDRIFAPFQRLHQRGIYEGTGIGLAICRRIAERHGGSIELESRPGEGATFIVTLPAVPADDQLSEGEPDEHETVADLPDHSVEPTKS